MSILVLGAGAVGQWVGGRLAESGQEVLLVAHSPHLEALRAGNLALDQGTERTVVKEFRAFGSLEEIPPARRKTDLVILTVKSYSTAETAQEILTWGGRETPVLTLQNGIGNEEILGQILGKDRIYSGVVTAALYCPDPGRVVVASSGGIGLAPTVPGQDMNLIKVVMGRAGFELRYYGDYRPMKWSKLLLNILGNATSAILDMTPEEIFENPKLFDLEVKAYREAVTVMMSHRLPIVKLPRYPVPLFSHLLLWLPQFLMKPLLQKKMGQARGEKMPSLHRDLANGKGRLEVDNLNGVVVKYARDKGLEAPVNDLLTRTLKGLAEGKAPREQFRRTPERLVSLLRYV